MTRKIFIERILRQIYNGQPTDDSSITFNQVNQWLNDAIGVVVKKNYTESVQLDGVAYVNNSFYSTFAGLSINNEDFNTYTIDLPLIPYSLGRNEGVSSLQFKDDTHKTSHTAIPLSINQVAYQEVLRPIQNKILYWPENNKLYVKTGIPLANYTATVRMISGGDSSDLSSTLIVPDDYVPVIVEYIKAQLAYERSRPIDQSNDGVDNVN
jgi:hypothetical protein